MHITNFKLTINPQLLTNKIPALRSTTNPITVNFTGSDNKDRVELSEKARFIRQLENTPNVPTYEISVQLEGEKQPLKLKKYSGTQFGTNPGFWAFNENNNKLYYIKYAKNKDKIEHIRSEIEASKLYNLAGIKTPEIKSCKIYGEQFGLASEYVSGMQEITNPKDVHIAFAVDAWLANWDSLIDNNTMVVDGKPLKLDNGGALNFRALGELKPNFGNNVDELVTLVDGTNPESKNIYSSISHKTLVESFKRVCQITDKEIKEVVSDKTIAQTLINRRDYMFLVLQNIIETPYTGKNISKYMKTVTQNIDLNTFEPYKCHEEFYNKYTNEINRKEQTAPSTKKTHKLFLNLIKEKEKQGVRISREQLIEFLEAEAKKGIQIQHFLTPFQAKAHQDNYRRTFNNLYLLAERTDIKDDETISEYLNRVIKASERRKKQIDDFRIKNIINKLKYEPQDKVEKSSIPEDMREQILEELNENIKDNYESMKPLKPDATDRQIIKAWRKMCVGDHGNFSNETNKCLMNCLERYNSSQKPTTEFDVFYNDTDFDTEYTSEFKYEPVYRWLSFNNPETFIESLPRNGEIMVADRTLSCSMNKIYAEEDYNDGNRLMNVKFIIHPKSEVSNARILGYNQEVLYPAGEKFKMLDKELVECYTDKKKENCFFRWEIHVQEA